MKKIQKTVLAGLLFFSFYSCSNSDNSASSEDQKPEEKKEVEKEDLPEGWIKYGEGEADHLVGTDKGIYHSGNSSLFISSESASIRSFTTIMRIDDVGNFNGNQAQFSVWIKTENIDGWSGAWMRIDDANGNILGFDNMANRMITGTNDWSEYKVVLDVPDSAATINYGVLLSGAGKVWFDDYSLTEVDTSVATAD